MSEDYEGIESVLGKRPYGQEWGSFEEAKAYDDGLIVLVGGFLGQTYVIAPSRDVFCSGEDLQDLLAALDAIAWPVNRGEGAEIQYQRAAPGSVLGWEGPELVPDSVWIDEEFESLGLSEAIRGVLAGDLTAIEPLNETARLVLEELPTDFTEYDRMMFMANKMLPTYERARRNEQASNHRQETLDKGGST
ncbi:MAG TPA: hypothetical protein VMR52_13175 [Dehalococcoidia bacterium]|nr:hypothetical protein [Dehalococcoidia bacterium]